MRSFFFLIGLLVLSTSSFAQDELSVFSERISTEGISFDYGFEIKTSVVMKGSGAASIKGQCYRVNGDGLQIICDGRTRWTIGELEKEAVIESVDECEADYMANPATLLNSISSSFKCVSSDSDKLDGRNVKVFSMIPGIDNTGLDSVTAYFSGSDPVAVRLMLEDGTVAYFTLKNLKYGQNKEKAWSFDPASLDSEYVVTDLR